MQQLHVNISVDQYVSFRLGENELLSVKSENDRLIKENESKKREIDCAKRQLENKRIELQNASKELAKIQSICEINKEKLKQFENRTSDIPSQLELYLNQENKINGSDGGGTIGEPIKKIENNSMVESEKNSFDLTEDFNELIDEETANDMEDGGDPLKKTRLKFTVHYDVLLSLFCDKLEKREDVKILKGYPSIRSSVLFTDYCKIAGVKFPSCIKNKDQRKCFIRINVGNFNKCISKLENMRAVDGCERNLYVIKDRYPHVQYVAAGRIDM